MCQYTSCDDCVSGPAGAFAGLASGLGSDASPHETGRGPMGHPRAAAGSGEYPSARHVLYQAFRLRVSGYALGQALHVSRLALSVARLGRTYLSALLQWKTGKSWKRFEQIVLKPGYRCYGKARVWQEEMLETYVSLVWDPGCEEPWLLISDQGAGRRQVQV